MEKLTELILTFFGCLLCQSWLWLISSDSDIESPKRIGRWLLRRPQNRPLSQS